MCSGNFVENKQNHHHFYPNKNKYIERDIKPFLYLTYKCITMKYFYSLTTCLLQDFKLSLLVSKINDTESAMAEIETAASKHLQGLALQSEQALEGAQKKLMIANDRVEEFTIFVKV